MSDVTLLRKLTHKSTLKFGKYSELAVNHMIDLKRHAYLRWVYFNCSNITFIDDILEEIGVYANYRIQKPGKNPELGVELDELKSHHALFLPFKVKKHNAKVLKGKKLCRFVSFKQADRIQFSKGALARQNQGHR
jgi:hypothetical protein